MRTQGARIPISTELLRDSGTLEGDEEEFARFSKPYRNGILSPARVSRASRGRLIRDSRALRAALRNATNEIADLKAHIDGRERKFHSFIKWPTS